MIEDVRLCFMDIPFLDASAIESRTNWHALIDAFDANDWRGITAPARTVYGVTTADGAERNLMYMPAWTRLGRLGVKLITVSPKNPGRGNPSINGLYVLFDADTGRPCALFDAAAITARRTAAVAAVATRQLAATSATTHLIVGTGRLAREMAEAIACVRSVNTVMIWGRDQRKAAELSASVGAECVSDLPRACRIADIITTVTGSSEPLVRGEDLKVGAHINLIGAFRPTMRECDAEVLNKADRVYVDNLAGAQHEAGDLIQAIAEGCFDWSQIAGDLATLCRNRSPARKTHDITVFKSVGGAEQDLVAATLCAT